MLPRPHSAADTAQSRSTVLVNPAHHRHIGNISDTVGLLILILRTKARRWSDQPRSKHAFATPLSTLESVGLTRRAPSRTMQGFNMVYRRRNLGRWRAVRVSQTLCCELPIHLVAGPEPASPGFRVREGDLSAAIFGVPFLSSGGGSTTARVEQELQVGSEGWVGFVSPLSLALRPTASRH
jgi:hypothetical protein